MRWFLFICAAFAAPAHSQAMQEGLIGAQIIQGGVDAQGRPLAAISITLTPGWKTYWRAPGEGGLPPEFDWTGSQNLKNAEFFWPRPEMFESAGFVNFGYHEQLVLPFALIQDRPDQPSLLALRISLGICKDICIPAEISLEAQVTGQEAAHLAILAALADQPITAQAAGLAAVSCQIAPISDGLRLSAVIDLPRPDMADYHSVAVEYGAAEVWVSSPNTQRAGDSLRVVVDLVPPQAKPFDLNPQDLRLTLLGDTRAIDVQGCQIVTRD